MFFRVQSVCVCVCVREREREIRESERERSGKEEPLKQKIKEKAPVAPLWK